MSRPARNRVKRIVFNLLNIKYGNVFKRPNLPLEFKAFALATKKLIRQYMTINKYRGIKVIIADTL